MREIADVILRELEKGDTPKKRLANAITYPGIDNFSANDLNELLNIIRQDFQSGRTSIWVADSIPLLDKELVGRLKKATAGQPAHKTKIDLQEFNSYLLCDNRDISEFIPKGYARAKGKNVAILYLALKQAGALTTITRTEFYRAFLSLFGRESELSSFRKGVDKYLNEQGKPKGEQWITSKIQQGDVAPVIGKLSSQK